jgi:hypothetical protein
MAARRSRVEINRGALDEVMGGLADGVFDVARAIGVVAASQAPRSEDDPDVPPLEHLEDVGGAIVWVNARKVHEWSSGTRRPDKPRALRVRSKTIVGAVGFAFPAMFVELGTLKARAHPFFTPAVAEIAGSQARILLSQAMERRLAKQRSAKTFLVHERVAASRARNAAGGG